MHAAVRSTAVVTLLSLTSQLSFAQQSAPKAEEIFARHVAAIGGKEAILKVSSIKTIGSMQIVQMGITAPVETIMAAPNLMLSKMTIPGIGDIASGFDGKTGWEVDPMHGPRIKSEKETLMMAEDSDFYSGLLYSKQRYTGAATVGAVEFGGEKTWQVRMVLRSGRVVNDFFSIETGFRVGSQSTQESAQGTIELTRVDSAYKQFGGIMVATKREVLTGSTKMVMTASDIVIGEISPSVFALPAPIKALISTSN
ncbi:MAG: hypothetical protein ABJC26_10805 [Gemmatimonadaceae bacterium]